MRSSLRRSSLRASASSSRRRTRRVPATPRTVATPCPRSVRGLLCVSRKETKHATTATMKAKAQATAAASKKKKRRLRQVPPSSLPKLTPFPSLSKLSNTTQRRGIKVYGGQPVKAGGIIVRQLGTKVNRNRDNVNDETKGRRRKIGDEKLDNRDARIHRPECSFLLSLRLDACGPVWLMSISRKGAEKGYHESAFDSYYPLDARRWSVFFSPPSTSSSSPSFFLLSSTSGHRRTNPTKQQQPVPPRHRRRPRHRRHPLRADRGHRRLQGHQARALGVGRARRQVRGPRGPAPRRGLPQDQAAGAVHAEGCAAGGAGRCRRGRGRAGVAVIKGEREQG